MFLCEALCEGSDVGGFMFVCQGTFRGSHRASEPLSLQSKEAFSGFNTHSLPFFCSWCFFTILSQNADRPFRTRLCPSEVDRNQFYCHNPDDGSGSGN